MKLIFAALLSLVTTATLGDENPKLTNYSRELAYSLLRGFCGATTQPTSQIVQDGVDSQTYDASNDELHVCQYITEISESGCAQAGDCQSYEAWNKANPSISPTQPRELFLLALSARKLDTQNPRK